MAVVKMRKFSFLTFQRHKSALLKELQKFGGVHFKNLQYDADYESEYFVGASTEDAARSIEEELAKVNFALDKTRQNSGAPKGMKALMTPPDAMDYAEFDTCLDTYRYDDVCARIKYEDERIVSINTEIGRLRTEIEAINPWLKLDVAPSALDRYRYVKSEIGAINRLLVDELRAGLDENYPRVYIETIGAIKDDVTLIVVALKQDYDDAYAYIKALGFTRMPLGFKDIPANVVHENTEKIASLQEELAEAQDKISELGVEFESLQIVADYFETALARERASENFLTSKMTIVAEGWVPEADFEAFLSVVDGVCSGEYYLQDEDVPKDSEDVPIKLKNGWISSAFEDVTVMFSMPKYNELDPTPLLMPFYMVSFGLMVGDIGYGVLMVLATALALKLFYLGEGAKRFLRFFFFLGIATTFGGLVYGGAFGYTVFTPIPVGDGTYKAILDTATDVVPMLLVSVGIGVVQILFGLLVKGYALLKDGQIFAALFDSLLLVIALLAAIGMLLGGTGILPASISALCPKILTASLLGLTATQGREYETLAGKIGGGIYAVYGLSSYVGDFISYTRIAALALSGAYIAFSFNLMAELMPQGIIRILFGSVIFIVGQSLNLGLALLGAYVHSARLQYVEYFGKFFEGGGVPYDPFELKNKYTKINK